MRRVAVLCALCVCVLANEAAAQPYGWVSNSTLPPAAPQQPWSLWTPPALTVQWAAPLTGSVDDYVLEFGSSSGGSDLGRIVVPGDRLSVTQAVESIRAYMRIRARNACGASAPSAEVVVSTR